MTHLSTSFTAMPIARGALLVLILLAAPSGCTSPGGPINRASVETAKSNTASVPQEQSKSASPFVGRYNGSSFETAMGMEIFADGTFAWGLSVGSLDMTAKGVWAQKGDLIDFTSKPPPVPPEMVWSGVEKRPDAPLVKVILADSGKPFEYADVRVECSSGNTVYGQIPAEGWSPDPGECANPVSIMVEQSNYEVTSQLYPLNKADWEPGDTIVFAFRRNDLGVMDMTGMTGRLLDGILTTDGPLGSADFRKVGAHSGDIN